MVLFLKSISYFFIFFTIDIQQYMSRLLDYNTLSSKKISIPFKKGLEMFQQLR